MVIFECYVKAM